MLFLWANQNPRLILLVLFEIHVNLVENQLKDENETENCENRNEACKKDYREIVGFGLVHVLERLSQHTIKSVDGQKFLVGLGVSCSVNL